MTVGDLTPNMIGKARIRVQLSAAHSAEDVEAAVAALVAAREAVQG